MNCNSQNILAKIYKSTGINICKVALFALKHWLYTKETGMLLEKKNRDFFHMSVLAPFSVWEWSTLPPKVSSFLKDQAVTTEQD